MEAAYGPEVLRDPGCRGALIEAAIVLNAAWTAYCLQHDFRDEFPELGVAFGAYDLVTRHVRLPLSPPGELTAEEKGLFTPPKDIDGFRELGLRICSGKLVRRLLKLEGQPA